MSRSQWLRGGKGEGNPTIAEDTREKAADAGTGKDADSQSVMPATADASPQTPAAALQEAAKVIDRLRARLPENLDALELAARLQRMMDKPDEAAKLWKRALELNPDYPHAHLGLGAAAAKQGDYEEAASRFRKVLKVDPRSLAAYYDLAYVLAKLERTDESAALLERYLEMNPRSAAGHVLLGQARLKQQQYAKARKAFESAITLEPSDPRAHAGMAGVCRQANEMAAAKQYEEKQRELEAARKRQSDFEQSPARQLLRTRAELAGFYTDVGRIYYATGTMEEAEQAWRRAAAMDLRNTDCRGQLAILYQQGNRLAEAAAICEELARSEPKNPLLWINLGVVLLRMERFDAAERAFQQSVDVGPERYEGYAALAQLYLRSNWKLPEARVRALKASQLAATAPNFYLLAVASERNGDMAAARQSMDRAIELDPNNRQYQAIRKSWEAKTPKTPETKLATRDVPSPAAAKDSPTRLPPGVPTTHEQWVDDATKAADALCRSFPRSPAALTLAGRMYASLGNLPRAFQCWEECVKLDPGFVAAWRADGVTAWQRGQFDRAARCLRRVLEIEPGSVEASTYLADALLNLGKADEAIDVLEKAARAGPLPVAALFAFGQAYLQGKKYESAKNRFEEALAIDPNMAQAHYGLATVLERLDQRDQAQKHRNEYARLKRQSTEAVARERAARRADDLGDLNPILAEFYRTAGRIYAAQSRTDEAESLLRRATALTPQKSGAEGKRHER